jgi:hypothetical protein
MQLDAIWHHAIFHIVTEQSNKALNSGHSTTLIDFQGVSAALVSRLRHTICNNEFEEILMDLFLSKFVNSFVFTRFMLPWYFAWDTRPGSKLFHWFLLLWLCILQGDIFWCESEVMWLKFQMSIWTWYLKASWDLPLWHYYKYVWLN